MSASKTATTVVIDESRDDVENSQGWAFKRPTKRGFKSNGAVSLTRRFERLSSRARANLTELAREGNTDASRAYWTRVLRDRYGITV